jgi:myo-inositol-1(or 4)-monophosphatase
VSVSPPQGFDVDALAATDVERGELEAALGVATAACDRARGEILPRFRRVAVETKADGSPVTEADRAAERAIRETIEAAFPDDAILGEEFGETDRSSRRRWVIDPIDGTIAFARGIPLFTTLVSLLVDDVPVLGVIDLPAVGDRITGYRGGGIERGGVPLAVSTRSDASDTLVCHGDVYCFDRAGLRPVFDRMVADFPKLRGYTDAFGHGLVLSGAVEAMVDCDLNPWDAAATRVLCAEAGGLCWVRERQDGRKLDLVFGRPETVERIGRLF